MARLDTLSYHLPVLCLHFDDDGLPGCESVDTAPVRRNTVLLELDSPDGHWNAINSARRRALFPKEAEQADPEQATARQALTGPEFTSVSTIQRSTRDRRSSSGV